jgi:hypothetical protein
LAAKTKRVLKPKAQLGLTRFRWLKKPSLVDLQRARALYDDLPDDAVSHMQAWDVIDDAGRVVYEMLYHSFDHATFYRPGSIEVERSIAIIVDQLVCNDERFAESLTRAFSNAQHLVKDAYLANMIIPSEPPYGVGRVLTVTKKP